MFSVNSLACPIHYCFTSVTGFDCCFTEKQSIRDILRKRVRKLCFISRFQIVERSSGQASMKFRAARLPNEMKVDGKLFKSF